MRLPAQLPADSRLPLLPVVVLLCAGGCGAPGDTAGFRAQGISGGYDDETSTSVVGVLSTGGGVAMCSGSLIAPNLVLTARHCVSATLNEVNGGVDCGTTIHGAVRRASTFFVTTEPQFGRYLGDYLPVQEVVVLPPTDDESFCGTDFAMLVLEQPVPAEVTLPIMPRVDEPLVADEVYSAVGYGAINDNGTGAGLRRRRDDLHVDCVDDCPLYIYPEEWGGEAGICQGDSGGPALDAQGRVVGIASRGLHCLSPIYSYVFARADWVKQTALHAATVGGYTAPAWATGFPTDSKFNAPVGVPCTQPADCAFDQCLADEKQTPAESYCTRACADAAPCPEGWSCDASDASRGPVCRKDPPPPPPPAPAQLNGAGGCSLGGRRVDPAAPSLALLVAALLLRRRRARR